MVKQIKLKGSKPKEGNKPKKGAKKAKPLVQLTARMQTGIHPVDMSWARKKPAKAKVKTEKTEENHGPGRQSQKEVVLALQPEFLSRTLDIDKPVLKYMAKRGKIEN
eukprot:Phypoly_transcript_16790.p1 GENE.Phypoly_transcript_16790~~Phypoly_transcript_16790.p1  ORF type:complete len:107 (+),score=21.84 Phypoly_transcript_16790:216-536(+)